MLTRIASVGGRGLHNARDLAQDTGVPLPTVSKLLKSMARSGLLEAHRGVKGGYSLSRTPSEIKVTEIINALEGPISITECSGTGGSDCLLEAGCPVRVNWQRINQAVHSALDKITLADMAIPASEGVKIGCGGACGEKDTDGCACSGHLHEIVGEMK